MQVENLGKLERRLSISVTLAEIESEVDTRLKRLTRTVKMAGFRPGKVPLKVVAQQYGYQVQNEVLNEKIGRAFDQAVTENQLRVAGAPSIAPKAGEAAAEGTVAFDATFEVYPEVKLGDLAGAEVERVTTTVGDAEIDKTIDILRKQRVHYHTKGEAGEHAHLDPTSGGEPVAAHGDRITVDFAGTLDGTPFAGGTANDYTFVLGEGRMLPEFEAAAIGLKAGESRTFPLSFPEDYHGKDVAGKTAEFKLTVKHIEWAHLPEVDAEFAQSLGIPDGDREKMRADIRSNLEREVKKRVHARTKESVMNALIKLTELDVPKALLDSEVQRLIESTKNDMRQRGMKEDMPFPPELFQAQAERRVRLGLILAELVRANELQAKPEQIKAQVEDYAQSYENPAEVVRWYYADRSRLSEVEGLVLEENVVNYVIGLAQVKETPLAFDELMGNANA